MYTCTAHTGTRLYIKALIILCLPTSRISGLESERDRESKRKREKEREKSAKQSERKLFLTA